MTTDANSLMEMLLRQCGAASGEMWFPSDFIREANADRIVVEKAVDELRLAGLIRIVDWVSGKGQGYTLTEQGRTLLNNPRQLDRLVREGPPPAAAPRPTPTAQEMPVPWERSKQLIERLQSPKPPVVLFGLLAANLMVFAWGMALAQNRGVLNEYFSMSFQQMDPQVAKIRHETGALQLGVDVAQGEWWRILTSCFVHHGPIHLAMNMFGLFILGRFIEQAWGRLQTLIIFLASGVGGSLLEAVTQEQGVPGALLAGASGAICGFLGAALVWVVLNKRHLPPALGSSLMRNVIINVVLISIISTIPGISWKGHLGGGVVGAIVAIPLNWTLVGDRRQMLIGWIATAGLIIIGLSYGAVQLNPSEAQRGRAQLARARSTYQPALLEADRLTVQFVNQYAHPAFKVLRNGEKLSNKQRTKTLEKLNEAQQYVRKTDNDFANAPEYEDKRINVALENSRKLLKASDQYFEAVRSVFDADAGNLVVAFREASAALDNRRKLAKVVQESVLVTNSE